MKAIVSEKFGGIEQLHISDVPTPEPTKNEVQIEIAYTSVNPVDWKILSGAMQKILPHEFPFILGWDAAGKVSRVGNVVSNFKVGDEVFAYCRKPIVKWGTYAEFVCFDAHNIARKPKNLSFAQAASLPLVGLTAWQALFDSAKFKKGQTVLIHAGAGGVGSLAIEFAKAGGAKKIYTTASKNHHDYVKSLGADVAIDYKNTDFVNKIKESEPNGVDVVIDCVGHDTLEKSFDVVKPNGYLVSMVQKVDEKRAKERNIHGLHMFVSPNGGQLESISKWIDEGKIKPPHVTEMPLSDYAKALKQSQDGHTQGKIVLKIKK